MGGTSPHTGWLWHQSGEFCLFPFHYHCHSHPAGTLPPAVHSALAAGEIAFSFLFQNFLLSWVKDVTDRQSKDSIKDFLLNLLKGTITGRQERSYYIGLSSQKVEGQWHWVDQTPYNQATT